MLQISLFAVWAGESRIPALSINLTGSVVFSSLRVYALSNNVRVIVGLVGLLSSAPVITFTVSVLFYGMTVDVDE